MEWLTSLMRGLAEYSGVEKVYVSDNNTYPSKHLQRSATYSSTEMAPLENPAVPKGSVVLVTGANGLLGSHIAKQFLEYGFKVRGTVRNIEKNSWISTVFDKEYGQGNFELVELLDMTSEDALRKIAEGKIDTDTA